jgi:thiosulfate/3-mercaptopyruvate sulfurtransferase
VRAVTYRAHCVELGPQLEEDIIPRMEFEKLWGWRRGKRADAEGSQRMSARSIDPLVSTDWLEARLGTDGLVIVDVRDSSDYAVDHIAGTVSMPFGPVSGWAVSDDELLMELPSQEALFKTIGECGISRGSRVVVVGGVPPTGAPPYPLADATRVAATLIYAGVGSVAILDGGYPKWAGEGRATTTGVSQIVPVEYAGSVDSEMFVSTDYVKEHLGKAVILDARDPDVYFGVRLEPWAQKPGHIPTAKSLPTPWIWGSDHTFQQASVLEGMAAGVVDGGKDGPIIVYCGVGGYASSWWFVLTQVLGYGNVKFYDGAAQAWVKENPMTAFSWIR